MKLALGTAQFGGNYGISNTSGQVSRIEATTMLGIAKNAGIDTIDTAIMYGGSECCLGAVGIKDFNIISKLPSIPSEVNSVGLWIDNQINASLGRLEVSSMYGLLIHNPSQLMDPTIGGDIYKNLRRLKESGLVKKIGVSIYDPNQLEAMISKFKFDIVQAPLNVFDSRLADSGWLKKLSDMGIEIHVRSVFLQGLLLLPKEKLPTKFIPWNEMFESWHKSLNNQGLTTIEAALAYAMSFSEVRKIIVGAIDSQQLDEIIQASYKNKKFICPSDLKYSLRNEALINPSLWETL